MCKIRILLIAATIFVIDATEQQKPDNEARSKRSLYINPIFTSVFHNDGHSKTLTQKFFEGSRNNAWYTPRHHQFGHYTGSIKQVPRENEHYWPVKPVITKPILPKSEKPTSFYELKDDHSKIKVVPPVRPDLSTNFHILEHKEIYDVPKASVNIPSPVYGSPSNSVKKILSAHVVPKVLFVQPKPNHPKIKVVPPVRTDLPTNFYTLEHKETHGVPTSPEYGFPSSPGKKISSAHILPKVTVPVLFVQPSLSLKENHRKIKAVPPVRTDLTPNFHVLEHQEKEGVSKANRLPKTKVSEKFIIYNPQNTYGVPKNPVGIVLPNFELPNFKNSPRFKKHTIPVTPEEPEDSEFLEIPPNSKHSGPRVKVHRGFFGYKARETKRLLKNFLDTKSTPPSLPPHFVQIPLQNVIHFVPNTKVFHTFEGYKAQETNAEPEDSEFLEIPPNSKHSGPRVKVHRGFFGYNRPLKKTLDTKPPSFSHPSESEYIPLQNLVQLVPKTKVFGTFTGYKAPEIDELLKEQEPKISTEFIQYTVPHSLIPKSKYSGQHEAYGVPELETPTHKRRRRSILNIDLLKPLPVKLTWDDQTQTTESNYHLEHNNSESDSKMKLTKVILPFNMRGVPVKSPHINDVTGDLPSSQISKAFDKYDVLKPSQSRVQNENQKSFTMDNNVLVPQTIPRVLNHDPAKNQEIKAKNLVSKYGILRVTFYVNGDEQNIFPNNLVPDPLPEPPRKFIEKPNFISGDVETNQILKRAKRSAFINPIFSSVFNNADPSKTLKEKFFEGSYAGNPLIDSGNKDFTNVNDAGLDVHTPSEEYGVPISAPHYNVFPGKINDVKIIKSSEVYEIPNVSTPKPHKTHEILNKKNFKPADNYGLPKTKITKSFVEEHHQSYGLPKIKITKPFEEAVLLKPHQIYGVPGSTSNNIADKKQHVQGTLPKLSIRKLFDNSEVSKTQDPATPEWYLITVIPRPRILTPSGLVPVPGTKTQIIHHNYDVLKHHFANSLKDRKTIEGKFAPGQVLSNVSKRNESSKTSISKSTTYQKFISFSNSTYFKKPDFSSFSQEAKFKPLETYETKKSESSKFEFTKNLPKISVPKPFQPTTLKPITSTAFTKQNFPPSASNANLSNNGKTTSYSYYVGQIGNPTIQTASHERKELVNYDGKY